MKTFLISEPEFNPLKQNLVELDNTDETPPGVYINLPNGDGLIITREFIETYAEIYREIEEKGGAHTLLKYAGFAI